MLCVPALAPLATNAKNTASERGVSQSQSKEHLSPLLASTPSEQLAHGFADSRVKLIHLNTRTQQHISQTAATAASQEKDVQGEAIDINASSPSTCMPTFALPASDARVPASMQIVNSNSSTQENQFSSLVSIPSIALPASTCAHASFPNEERRPEETVSSDESYDSEISLTRMHLDDSPQAAEEGRVNALAIKSPRTNLLKPTIVTSKDKPKSAPKSVKFTRDPSPRRTRAHAMLAQERLIDAEENLLPAIGNTDLTAAQAISLKKKDLLEPTYFAAYVVPKAMSPFCSEYEEQAVRVIGHVDTGASPWSVVSQSFVDSIKCDILKHRTSLGLGDKTAKGVESESICDFNLRVTIGDRARTMHLKAVIWPDEKCTCPLLISRTDALRTGLMIFVHDNDIREALLGIAALTEYSGADPIVSCGKVAVILSEEEDQALHERISPIEGIRAAKQPAAPSKDPWVREFMATDLVTVFGPIPQEPADVPFLNFGVNKQAISKMTYANTQPIRIAPAAPRKQDSIDAHVEELKDYNAVEMAYPTMTPGPIAAVAFTVPKPGTNFVSRPQDIPRRMEHPLTQEFALLHRDYLLSLTADRLVVNFKPTNDVTVVQHYPVPTVQENLQKLSKFKYYSKIDITKAFWSIGVAKRCRKYLYTIAPGGHAFFWTRAPMGHSAVPGHFQYCINGVLHPHRLFAFAFADDIIVGGNTKEELKANVEKVLRELMRVGFRVNSAKCQLFPQEEIKYLGWIINQGRVYPVDNTLEKLWAVRRPCDCPKSSDKEKRKMVKRFLGVCLYLGAYLPNAAENLAPLHKLTSAKKSFKWTTEAETAWDWAITFFKTIQPLHFPSNLPGSWLETLSDASKLGWGGILVEWRKGDPKPYLIMCVAGTFSTSQLNWPTIQKECFAAWMTVRKCKGHIDGREFVLNMDHKNLLWSAMSTNEVVRRLATDLQQYQFTMKHIDGELNVLADYLSRAEHITPEEFQRMRAARASSRSKSPSPRSSSPSPSRPEANDGGNTSMPPSSTENDSVDDTSSNFNTDSEYDSDSFSGTVKPVIGGQSRAAEIPQNDHQPQQQAQPQLPPQQPAQAPQQPIGPNAAAAQPQQALAVGGRRPQARRPRQPRGGLLPRAMIADDGLDIPFLEALPNPPVRFLPPDRFHLLHKFHGGVSPHTGVQAMIQALQEAGHQWPTLQEDVRCFIARCHLCQLERLNRRGPLCLPYRSILIPASLFEVWNFDIIGPLQKCDLSGSTYVMVGVEEVSHLTNLDHSIEASTPELMMFLIQTFKFFGLPKIIKTDVGSQFISKTVADFCKATGIEHRFGVPHNHRSDGTVEITIQGVWRYLRLAIHDLKRYAAWSPLLANVMLGCNSLPREVLGGASASALIFNRKVQPMRFLRPKAIQAPGVEGANVEPEAPVAVNTFIADQAAQQLRLLYFATETRQQRYGESVSEADKERMRQEEEHQGRILDWVRVGQLVSIPQEEHENHLRPTKMSLRRTGPYEVMSCENTTVTLRDRRSFLQLQNPVTFVWPKRELWPYYARTQPTTGEAGPPPHDPNPDDLPILSDIDVANAVLLSRPLDEPNAIPAQHVKNFEYLVRWENKPHTETTWCSYQQIWHSTAFQDFVRNSGLTGHVAPTEYQLFHRQHVNQLLRGDAAPNRRVPVANPRAVVHNLFDYFPGALARQPNARALRASEDQDQQQSQQSQSQQNSSQHEQ